MGHLQIATQLRRVYLCAAACCLLFSQELIAVADELFSAQVAPIFQQYCLRCHNGVDRQGGLSLESVDAFQAGGDSGPLLDQGSPEDSLLLLMVTPADGVAQMPKDGQPLSADQLQAVRRWVEQGARWPAAVTLEKPQPNREWWSLRALEPPALPQLAPEDRRWVRTPVDRFIIARLRQQGLAPSPSADRRTLQRRVYFDLTGLPPTPDQVRRFLSDRRPDAYERLVDELLGSPRFGERWARHWLDVVHYADTHGYDKDKPRPHAWPYRDYVIEAFNRDLPYGEFLRQQIAADDSDPDDPQAIRALGFLAAGPWDFISHVEVPESKIDGRIARHLDRDDMVRTTWETFNSLTVGCARCHDHKFDPISQRQYYAMQAVFAAVDRANRPLDSDRQVFRRREELRQRSALMLLEKRRAEGEDPSHLQKLEGQLQQIQRQLQELPPPRWVFAAATLFEPEGSFQPTLAVPRPVHLLHRGNVLTPGEVVQPAAPDLFGPLPGDFQLDADHVERQRRRQLADWLASPQNPLTWRSIANRLWQYHFGRGIVATPNDFGRMGELPTHPDLLDWLAVQIRDGGQDLKRIHRMIVLSATYRQTSADHPTHQQRDSQNRYWWRMDRRRLDAEEIRDAVLATSGLLDTRMYGPGFQDFVIEKPEHSPHYQYHLYDPAESAGHRRSIYRFTVRSQQHPLMTALDCADPSMQVAVRDQTITPQQTLALLNNRLMLYAAERLAARLLSACDDPREQTTLAMQLTLGREPTAQEAAVLEQLVGDHGLATICRVLFASNEFVFLD
jgi:hypothetical protein